MPQRNDSYDDDTVVALSEGAAIVGVSPKTLRNYANDGRVACSWTPTGYRRFRVGDLRALLTSTDPNAKPVEPASSSAAAS